MRYFFFFWLLPLLGLAQFAPPVGQTGTTALYKDSSVFIGWASFCNVTRGLQDISNASGGYASIGDSSKATGLPDNSVVSLGDGGFAICTFQNPLANGPGPDFAVFENSFSDDYLEFGFVEVSSDGVNFFRFAATSNIQDTSQTGPFAMSDATLVNNLAGKYKALYGTPFDLQELQGTAGLNINAITHVKIIDVVGSINPAYATYDQSGHKINDPWPTAFASSGFDLDAVGVIHDITNSVAGQSEFTFCVYPNPSAGSAALTIILNQEMRAKNAELTLTDLAGNRIKNEKRTTTGAWVCSINDLAPGVYFASIKSGNTSATRKIIITQ